MDEKDLAQAPYMITHGYCISDDINNYVELTT